MPLTDPTVCGCLKYFGNPVYLQQEDVSRCDSLSRAVIALGQ